MTGPDAWIQVGVLFGLDLLALGGIAVAAALALRTSRLAAALLAASVALGAGQFGLWFVYRYVLFDRIVEAALQGGSSGGIAATFAAQGLVFSVLGATRWGLAVAGALVGRHVSPALEAPDPPASTA